MRKKSLFKILACFLIFLTVFNFTTLVYGTDGSSSGTSVAAEAFNTMYNLLINLLGAFVGFAFWGLRVGVLAICAAAQVLISGIVSLGGVSDGVLVTPFTIFFNQVPLLDVDFMNFDSGLPSMILDFRTQVATWYYVIRIIATVILLVILIYIGIRMALSTIAQDKVIYKKMLVDWASSLALLYLLHYFIIFVTKINSVLIGILKTVGNADDYIGNFVQWISSIGVSSVSHYSGFAGIASTIIYALIVWQTLKFLFVYLKRMLTIGFLIIISPLITITYSIDKIGDQRAQALNTWMKEFCYNILIQPFHCIMYLAFVNIAISLIDTASLDTMFGNINFVTSVVGTNTLAAGLLAIICIQFVNDGEKIIRQIFGFGKASSLTDMVAATAAVTTLANNAGKLGKSASGVGKMMGNMFGGTASKISKATSSFANKVKGVAATNTPLGKVAGAAVVVGNAVSGSAKFVASAPGKLATKVANTKAYKSVSGSIKTFEAARRAYVEGSNGNPGRAEQLAHGDGKTWDSLTEEEKNSYKERASAQFSAEHAISKDIGKLVGEKMKKGISGAKGSISSHLHDKEYISTVVGASAGLAMYGLSSSNAISSIMTGMGAYGATNEFLKHTKKELSKETSNTLQGVTSVTGQEYTTNEEKLNHMLYVKQMGDNGKFDPKQLSDILNRFTNELQGLKQGISQEQAETVATNIQRNWANNPGAFNFDKEFENAMKTTLGENTVNDMKASDLGDLKQKMRDFMTTYANASLYNSMKTASSVNVEPEDMVGRMADTKSTATPQIHQYDIQKTTTTVTYTNLTEVDNKIAEVNREMDKIKDTTQNEVSNLVNGLNQTISNLEDTRDGGTAGTLTATQLGAINQMRQNLNAQVEATSKNGVHYNG